MNESEHDLKSKLMMLAISCIGTKLGVEPDLLIRWLEGRCNIPSLVLKKIEQITYTTAPFIMKS